MINQHFVESYDPTIEDSYRKHVIIDGHHCMIEVLDASNDCAALRDLWIRDGEGFCWSIQLRAEVLSRAFPNSVTKSNERKSSSILNLPRHFKQ
jgi:GTPase KRas